MDLFITTSSCASLIAQLVQNPPAMQETRFNSWVRDIHRRRDRLPTPVFSGSPYGSAGKECACNAGDVGSIPGPGRSPGGGIGYPLQYSRASLVAQLVKNHLQCGRPGFNPWLGKIPWRREQLPTTGPENRPAKSWT